LHVTSSIGIAIYPQHGMDEKLLMLNADMAMYQVKRNGKNQAKVFESGMHN
jgi:GGDEF domain-containing protein